MRLIGNYLEVVSNNQLSHNFISIVLFQHASHSAETVMSTVYCVSGLLVEKALHVF